MVFRAIVCCAALIIGLLAALNVTAQSAGACNGAACGSAQPLNLMNFVNGPGKAGTAKTSAPAATTSGKAAAAKHRHAAKTAARAPAEAVAPSPEPAALPADAATAYAAHPPDDVQVVSGGDVNAIDLAMSKTGPAAETNGAAPGAGGDNRDRAKWADASEFHAEQDKPADAPASTNDAANNTTFRDDSWMGRFWSTIGDGYVTLMAMIKQLFS